MKKNFTLLILAIVLLVGWSNHAFAGATETCMYFNGSSYVLSPVNMNNYATLTVTAWVNPKYYSSYQEVFSNDNGGYDRALHAKAGQWVIFNNSEMSTGVSASSGVWQHVAVVFSASATKFYLNGELVYTGSGSSTLAGNSTTYIGGNSWSFHGYVDEMSFWNTELNQTQIKATMTDYLSGSESGLIAYYNFNEGSGTTINDGSSSGSYDATNHSGAWTNSYAMVKPTISSASSVTFNSFVANWTASSYGLTPTNYYVDVATDASFSNLVYSSTDAGTATSYTFTGLNSSTTYYYRVRAYNSSITKAPQYSGTASLTTLAKQNQTITFPTLSSVEYGSDDYSPGATSSSGLDVTYTSSNTAVVSIVSGKIHIVGAGSCTIYADQAGNGNYNAATQVSRSLTVSKATLVITADSQTKTYGELITFTGDEFTNGTLAYSDEVTSVTLSSSGAVGTAAVGSYSIVPSAATGTGLSNYNITYTNGTLTVNKAELTITANDLSKTYGTTLSTSVSNITSTGLLNSDAITSITLTSSGSAASATVGSYTIVPSAATGTGLSNYNITYSNGTLTVIQAALTITANNQSKTYGSALTIASTAFTTSGLANSDAVSSVTITCSGTAATASAGSYNIVPSAAVGTGLSNYSITYSNGTLTVNQAALTITANNQSKTYGSALTIASTAFATSGLLNSDAVSTVTITCSGTAATASAGSYNIVPSAAAGTGLSNYNITYTNGTLTVNQAALTITANNQSKTYGSALTIASTAFTTSGLLNSDAVSTVTITCSGAAATASVGSYNIVPSAAVGTGISNYSITYTNGTLTVNQAALTITASNQSKTYGTTLTIASTAFTTSGLANSDAVSSVTITCSGTAATASVGSYNIVPSVATGTGLSNYNITYSNGTLTVNQAALTITANNQSKTYGSALTIASTAFTTSGLLNSDAVSTVTITCSGTAATASAGSYNIVPSEATGTGLSNYNITYSNGTLTVNQATLTITARTQSKTYGTTFAFAGTEFTTSGLVNSDVVSSVTITCSGSVATASVGSYNIIPSAATGTGLSNYSITYSNGTLTVDQAALTITASNQNKTYGTTFAFAGTEFTTSGLVNSDVVSSVTLTCSGTAATVVVGSYNIVPSASVGSGLSNYSITYSNGTLTVSKAALTITASNQTKTYGDVFSFVGDEFTSSGLLNADAVSTVSISSAGSDATAIVGTFSIVPVSAVGSGLTNYDITYNNGSLVVSKAALSITANDQSKVYGVVFAFDGSEFLANGLLNSDKIDSVNLTSTATDKATTVGTYNIIADTAVGTGLSNYEITFTGGKFIVNNAELTITANNQDKVYGNALEFDGTEFTTLGLVNNDKVTTASINCIGAADTSSVGTYTIIIDTITGVGLSNYTVAYVTGVLSVTPATLTITADDQIKMVGNEFSFNGTEYNAQGLVNDDSIAAISISSQGSAADAVVGEYAIEISTASGYRLSNYSIGYVNGLFTVTAKSIPQISWATPADIVYGTKIDSTQLNAVAEYNGSEVAGTYAYSITVDTVLNAGVNQKLSVVFTPSDTTQYVEVSKKVYINITKAELQIAAKSETILVNSEIPEFEMVYSGFLNNDSVAVLDALPSITCNATSESPIGSYLILLQGGSDNNYTFKLINDSLFIVNKYVPVITWATPSAITYGTAISAAHLNAEATYADTTVSGTLTYSVAIDSILNASDNQLLSVKFVPANSDLFEQVSSVVYLTVNKAELAVSVENAERKVGEANPDFTITFSGFVNSDDQTDIDELPVAACEANTESVVGEYAIVVSGGTDNNYSFNYTNGTLAVVKNDGIELNKMVNVQVYPNPVVSTLTIETSSAIESGTYRIYAPNGQLMSVEKLNTINTKVEMGDFVPGVYIIKVQVAHKCLEYRVIKQ